MNYFQRALKNITRKKTKSLLLLITFFLIGNFVIIGIGISTAANQAKVLTRQSMRAVVEYQVDYEAINKMMENMSESEIEEFYETQSRDIYQIKPEEYISFLEDERVATFNCSNFTPVNLGLEPVKLGNKFEEQNSSNSTMRYEENGEFVEVPYKEPNFKVVTNRTDNMIELYEGTWSIVDGRFYNQEEINSAAPVCLINDQVAQLNGLSVGDTITIDYTNDYSYLLSSEGVDASSLPLKHDFEIIGLYSTVESVDPSDERFEWMSTWESPFNKILMPITSYSASQLELQLAMFDFYHAQNPDDPYWADESNRPTAESMEFVSSIVFLLKDPLDVDSFVNDYQSKLEGSYRTFNANNDTFKQMSRPLDSIGMYANVIVAIVVINAIVIITLVTALTLKTREYEIGVLLSIGASKFKVVAQMFAELLIIALVGFTLSVASGSLIASKAGEMLLNYQVAVDDEYASEQENIFYYGGDSYFTEVDQADLLSNYSVTISPVIIGEIYVAGIAIVLVSILIPSMMIMRFNPKKILTSSL